MLVYGANGRLLEPPRCFSFEVAQRSHCFRPFRATRFGTSRNCAVAAKPLSKVTRSAPAAFSESGQVTVSNCFRGRLEGKRAPPHGGRRAEGARSSCYTRIVQKNLTIKISEEAILWARRKAVEENTSVSRLVGEMLERQMRLSDDYWRAFEHWKHNQPLALSGAAERMSREELHERK